MTPENEGNSVDPPLLTQSSGPACLPCPPPHNSSLSGDSVDPPLLQQMLSAPALQLNNSTGFNFPSPPAHQSSYSNSTNGGGLVVQQRVFESSRTETSRFQSISTGDGRSTEVKSVVQSRDAHTCSVSVSGAPPTFISSISRYGTSCESTTPLSTASPFAAGEAFNSQSATKDAAAMHLDGRSFMGNQTTSASVSVSVDQRVTVSRSSNHPQQQILDAQTPQGPTQTPSGFSFETSELASRLKPQMTSSFLAREMGSIPVENDVDSILRKYGIETRKYNPPPLSLSRYSGGAGDVQRPFSSCRSSSMLHPSSSYSSLQHGKPYTSVPALRQMDVSQNNEALTKLTNQSQGSATDPPLPPPQSTTIGPSPHPETPAVAKPFTDQTAQDQPAPLGDAEVSATNDTSRNNDTQGETSVATAVDIQAHHGSSVDIKVAADGATGSNLTPTGSYSAVRGATTMMGYQGGYAAMRMRPGGYSTTSQPSNMDISPFDSSYLKNHLSATRYPSSTRVSGMLSETTPSGSIKDYSAGVSGLRSRTNTATDKLGFSLLQERQRLRHIDNLITSGPGRTSKPYMSLHHTPSTHTPSPGISRVSSASNNWGAVVSTNSVAAPAVPSYENPDDIANIMRAGSNVDTGQFNNNRTGHNNVYSPEIVERLMSKMQIQQQKQQPLQQKDKKPTKKVSCRNTQSAAAIKTAQTRPVGNPRASVNCKKIPASRQERGGAATKMDKKNTYMKGAGCSRQMDNSYNARIDGFELARELNRVWRQSLEQNFRQAEEPCCYRKGCTDDSDALGSYGYCGRVESSRSCCGEIGSMKGTSTTSVNNTSKSSVKRSTGKYQPYKTQVRREAAREEQVCSGEDDFHENMIKKALSSASQHLSQASPPSGMRYAWQEDAREHEQCKSARERSDNARERERCLIAATAFASGLIQKRQLQQQRLQHFNGGISAPFQPAGGKKKVKSGKATTVTGGSKVASAKITSGRPGTARATKGTARPKSSRVV